MRASEVTKVSGASEAGEVSQTVRAKLAGADRLVQANCTVKVPNLSRLRYLTLVGHLNKICLVILQGTLVGHLKSVM